MHQLERTAPLLKSVPWDKRILEELRLMAEDTEPVRNARLAAAVAIRGKVIAFGRNSLRSHPFHQRYGKNEFSPYWHAETHAIFNSLKRVTLDELHKATLYVVRVKRPSERSRDWALAMAQPCRGCRRCIFDFGIPRVVYSTEGGFSCDID